MSERSPTLTPSRSFVPVPTGTLQRQCAACYQQTEIESDCQECQKTRSLLQRRSVHQNAPADIPPAVRDVLKSPGHPLDTATRDFMESRFQQDFSQVRLHTHAQAAASARQINALAYTSGQNIVFASGQYTPHTRAGQHLLAHELAHVLQQQNRSASLQSATLISHPSDPAEQEAEQVANRVVAGEPLAPLHSVAFNTLQRQGDQQNSLMGERSLSRSDEVIWSYASPGGISGSLSPLMVSLYAFAINEALLKPRHHQALNMIGSALSWIPAGLVSVLPVGHTDNTGSPSVNLPLSRRRAEAVRNALTAQTQDITEAQWRGEDEPVESNGTVEGRSRNRRVDIFFTLPQTALEEGARRQQETVPPERPDETDRPPPQDERPPRREDRPRREDTQLPDDESLCEAYPILCFLAGLAGLVGLGALGLALLSMLGDFLVGSLGLSTLLDLLRRLLGGGNPPPPSKQPKQPEQPEQPEPQACPIAVKLPRGTLRAQGRGPMVGKYWLVRDFKMRLLFLQDATTGCDCSLGEYKQEVRGFSERTDPGGTPRRGRVPLVGGLMNPSTYREDARAGNPGLPYGHRKIREGEEDQFLPDRQTGCLYEGADEPGMNSRTPGQRMRFHFEFRGAPVDRRDRNTLLKPWKYWTVEGDFTVPQSGSPPSSPSTPTSPPATPSFPPPSLTPRQPQGGLPATPVQPRPYSGAVMSNQVPFTYISGLREPLRTGYTYHITIGFVTSSGAHTAEVGYHIVTITDTSVILASTNTTPINIAPSGEQPVVIEPHSPGRVSRRRIQSEATQDTSDTRLPGRLGVPVPQDAGLPGGVSTE